MFTLMVRKIYRVRSTGSGMSTCILMLSNMPMNLMVISMMLMSIMSTHIHPLARFRWQAFPRHASILTVAA